MTYFVVQNRGSGLIPFHIRLKAPPLPPELPDVGLEDTLKALIKEGAADPNKISLNQVQPFWSSTYSVDWSPF